jgi:hypothetical protein
LPEQPVDAARDQFLDNPDRIGFRAADGSQQDQISRLLKFGGDAAEDRRENRIGEIGQHDTDEPRTTGAKRRGDRVTAIALAARLLLHAKRHLRGDAVALRGVQRAGGGGAVHARGFGHGLKRGRTQGRWSDP